MATSVASAEPEVPQLSHENAASLSWKTSAKDLFAGTMAGITSKVIEYPFDTIKVLQQTQQGKVASPFQVLKQVVKTDGYIKGLYQGLTAPMFGAMAENAIIFTVYGRTKRTLEAHQAKTGKHWSVPVNASLAGAASGVAVAFWLTPVELVKVRLQAENTRHLYKGTLDCVLRTYREEGLGTFFRGHSTTLARETVGGGVYFFAYETMRDLFVRKFGVSRDHLNPGFTILAGAMSGISYWSIIFPADTLKSRIQASGQVKHSIPTLVKDIFKTQGVRGFYSGLSVTLARAVPANAVILLTYESVLKWLGPL